MRIQVKVKTRNKKNFVEKTAEGRYRIGVKAAPDKGNANAEIIETLSEYFGVPKACVTIVTGKTSTQKMINIESRGQMVERMLEKVNRRHVKTLKALAG